MDLDDDFDQEDWWDIKLSTVNIYARLHAYIYIYIGTDRSCILGLFLTGG